MHSPRQMFRGRGKIPFRLQFAFGLEEGYLCPRHYSARPALKQESEELLLEDSEKKLHGDIIRSPTENDNVIALRSSADEEAYAILRSIACRTTLESPRLFGSYTVGKPLVGELAPIRPREHRWEPQPQTWNPDLSKRIATQRPSTNYTVAIQKERDVTLRGLRMWVQEQTLARRRKAQAYNAERIRLLGPEIAAAHLILARRGRVKFHGVDRWYSKGDGNLDTVPGRFLDGVKVDTIDATGTDILYEGFEYFLGLRHLKSLSLRYCKDVDDWCLPKLFPLANTLQYLDLSGCHKITERGLACLYHLRNLKTLVLNDLPNAENKELTALLLEDELPLCEMVGVEYNKPALPSPLQERRNLETEWQKYRIPLFHRIASPDAVEVGNIAYAKTIAQDLKSQQKVNVELARKLEKRKSWFS